MTISSMLTPRRIAGIFDIPVEDVERAISLEPAIRPTSRADGIPIFSKDDVLVIRERLDRKGVKHGS
jgi:hypothetical protein